jgi:hypothetical protein
MNELMKKIIKIADEEKMEVISVSPTGKDEEIFKVFLSIIKTVNSRSDIKPDFIYLVWSESGVLLIPLIDGKLCENFKAKIDSEVLNIVCDMNPEKKEEKIQVIIIKKADRISYLL